jgi:molybdate transport system ATP-binding protein
MGGLHFDAQLRYDSGFELDARFEIGSGVTALFGHSGSGKSTVLGLIAGILRPQNGSIQLGDRILVDTQRRVFVPPEKRRIGIVFQDHLLFPHLTVRKNLLFGHGRKGARAIELQRVVETFEIGDLLDRLPGTLSGGQRQRVSLGRAILRGPEMLLLDEPFAALERGLKDRILAYLTKAVTEWQIPTLFVSHDRADVQRLADKRVVIAHGRIVEEAALDREGR